MLKLAAFMEEIIPGDTVAEISSGEQAGALLRDMAGQNKDGALYE